MARSLVLHRGSCVTFCASNTCSPWLCCNGYGRHGSAVGPGEACVGRRTRGPSTTLSPSGAVAVSRCAAHTAAPARSVGSAPCWRLRGNGGRSHDARGVDGDGEGTERTRRHCSRERGSGRAENRGGVGEWERRLARGDTATRLGLTINWLGISEVVPVIGSYSYWNLEAS